jgi:hypothetical protein
MVLAAWLIAKGFSPEALQSNAEALRPDAEARLSVPGMLTT